MRGEIITRDKYPEIYQWLMDTNSLRILKPNVSFSLNNEKINCNDDISILHNIDEIKYPFEYVRGFFDCVGSSLVSLKNSPKKVGKNFSCGYSYRLKTLEGCPQSVGGYFSFRYCNNIDRFIDFPKDVKGHLSVDSNNFSNNPNKKGYNKYVDMWIDFFEGISENEKIEYINNYKNKIDEINKLPIIPKEVINRYKIVFLLNDK